MRVFSRSQNPHSFNDNFCEATHGLRGSAYRKGVWPKPLLSALLGKSVPFPSEFWVVEDEGKVVGTIGGNRAATRPECGYLGFFEVDLEHPKALEISNVLLSTGSEWLRGQGVAKIYGPINYSTWFPYRFSVGESKEFSSWEPLSPPDYAELFLKSGFRLCQTYSSAVNKDAGPVLEFLKLRRQQCVQHGISFRSFHQDLYSIKEKDLPHLYDLTLACFQENFLFEPIPYEQFLELYVPAMSSKVDSFRGTFAVDAEGKPCGYLFGFVEKGAYLVKSLAVAPSARGKNVAYGMMGEQAPKMKEEVGFSQIGTALVRNGEISDHLPARFASLSPVVWQHDYHLFEMVL